IRRLLVEVPPGCSLRSDDIFWAFSGLRFETSGIGAILVPSSDGDMAERYLAESGATRWRSITPVVLPEGVRRRRIEPSRRLAEGSRFPKERLWHVELAFFEPCSGPMIIGDGRFCGLGIMAPVK